MSSQQFTQKTFAVFFGAVLLLTGCTGNPAAPSDTQVVLRGYLFAGSPVQDIQLTSSISIFGSDTADPPILNASVVLVKGNNTYALTPNNAAPGFYFYPGTDLAVSTGDIFQILVNVGGQQISAETTVPTKPEQLSLSTTTMHFQPDTIQTRFGLRYSVVGLDTGIVSWSNPLGDYYYIVIESVDSARQLLRGDSVLTRRFVSEPTNQTSYRINNNSILYTGLHILRLYHVNKEYADLYRSREQDSRALNEPLTNVRNGLGIFSAFASDSLSFSIVLE